jgi:hypothetical protein
MQGDSPKTIEEKHEKYRMLIEKAKNGDNAALEELITILEPDINTLAKFIKMPREDTIQEIKTSFIEILRTMKEE